MNHELGYTPLPDDELYLRARRRGILEVTCAHFNSGNRAINDWRLPRYSHQFRGGCAIGRQCTPEVADTFDMEKTVVARANKPKIPPHLAELGIPFLQALQDLHDDPDNWDVIGLTLRGYGRKDEIIANHCNT